VHRRWSRWAQSKVWETVFQHLAGEADNEYAMIDSTIVRAHQHSAGDPKKTGKTRPLGMQTRKSRTRIFSLSGKTPIQLFQSFGKPRPSSPACNSFCRISLSRSKDSATTSHKQPGYSEFPPTSWTLVVSASDPLNQDCRDALARLCENYWYAIYAYVRRRGYPEDQA
jgi:hypothetical protein